MVKCDISNEEEVKKMVNKIIDKFGKIDVLVNNAAISIDSLYQDKTAENFRKTIDTNLVGTFLVSKYVGDIMYENKYGKIVNVTSTNGINTYFPMCLDYDASKAGIISLTHNLAMQYSPYINVNAVAPGMMRTPMNKEALAEREESYLERIPLKRIADPSEVASVVAFLCSKDADYMTGTTLDVTGGMLMR